MPARKTDTESIAVFYHPTGEVPGLLEFWGFIDLDASVSQVNADIAGTVRGMLTARNQGDIPIADSVTLYSLTGGVVFSQRDMPTPEGTNLYPFRQEPTPPSPPTKQPVTIP